MNPKRKIPWWVFPTAFIGPGLLVTLLRFVFGNDAKSNSIAFACLAIIFIIVLLLAIGYKMKTERNVAYKFTFIFIFSVLIFMAAYTLLVYEF
jgi:hypothetical protein